MKTELAASKKVILGKLLNITVYIFAAACLAILFGTFTAKFNGSLVGYRSFIVLSGSMSPTFEAGSFIIVKNEKPENINSGDIITFKVNENTVLTHRVVEIVKDGNNTSFITKGDANNSYDKKPVIQEQILGVAVLWINGVGAFLVALQQHGGLILIITLLFLMIFIIKYFIKSSKKIERGDKDENG